MYPSSSPKRWTRQSTNLGCWEISPLASQLDLSDPKWMSLGLDLRPKRVPSKRDSHPDHGIMAIGHLLPRQQRLGRASETSEAPVGMPRARGAAWRSPLTSQAGHTLYPASAEILGRSNAPNELERPKLKRPKLIQKPSTGSFSVCALATWDEQALNQDIQKVGQEIRCLGSVLPNHGPPNNTNCCLKTLWLGGMLIWNSPIGNLLNSQPASLSVLLADPQSASNIFWETRTGCDSLFNFFT